MNKINLEELSSIDASDLSERLLLFKKELFNLRCQKTIGEVVDFSRISKVRKNIARIYTEITKRKYI